MTQSLRLVGLLKKLKLTQQIGHVPEDLKIPRIPKLSAEYF